MLLNKTERAREALQTGSGSDLSMLERRVLIVTDGKRTLNEVMTLLGHDILPAIDRLIRDGYIDQGTKNNGSTRLRTTGGVTGALTDLLRATTDAVQARTEVVRASQPGPFVHAAAATLAATPAVITAPSHSVSQLVAPAARSGPRRSLVAAKMYIIDMLQLQRHPDAVELKSRIQITSDQDDLLRAILEGLEVLLALTNASYGQRVQTRLAEVLPEDALPALHDVIARVAGALDPVIAIAAPQPLRLVGS